MTIKRILTAHSEWDSDSGGYVELNNAKYELKTCLGTDELGAYDALGKLAPTDSIDEVIENGWPSTVLDLVEVWLEQNPKKARACERELNIRLLNHGSPWRIVDGEAGARDITVTTPVARAYP